MDIKYPFRIGITGHRNLNDANLEELRDRIKEILDEIQVKLNSHTGNYYLSGITSLAKGADLLFAEIITQEPYSGKLEVILPFVPEVYKEDFKEHSLTWQTIWKRLTEKNPLESFEHYLAMDPNPSIISTDSQPDKNWCYLKAGELMIDNCDVLIAIWDGDLARGPGGTQEIVDYAKGKRRPVYTIDPTSGTSKRTDPYPPNDKISIENMVEFSKLLNGIEAMGKDTEAAYKDFHLHENPSLWDTLKPIALAQKYWDKKACTAQNFNRLFFWLFSGIIVTATALGIVNLCLWFAKAGIQNGCGIPLLEDNPDLIKSCNNTETVYHIAHGFHKFELVLLIVAVGLFIFYSFKKYHNKWIHSRQLSEKLRMYIFKRACMGQVYETHSRNNINRANKQEDAIRRMYIAITKHIEASTPKLEQLIVRKKVLLTEVVEKQIEYHVKKEHSLALPNKIFKIMNLAFVVMAIVLVSFSVFASGTLEHNKILELKILSAVTVLPLLVALFEGIRRMIDYEKAEKVSANMAAYLEDWKKWLENDKTVQTEKELEFAFNKIEKLILSENDEWELLPTPLELHG